MTIHINISDVEKRFSEILNKVIEGEEVMIDKSGNTVAKLISVKGKKKVRKAGLFKDIIRVSDDIDKPLPDNILKEFYK